MNQNCAKRYYTPLVFQIITTIAFIAQIFLMFLLICVYLHPMYTYYTRIYSNIFGIFDLNFNNFVAVLTEWLAITATIVGIVFIWLNKPKISAACSFIILLIMLLALYVMGYPIKYRVELPNDDWYILWAMVAVLSISAILSIIFTKKGPRQRRRPKVVAVIPSSQTQSSVPDEIKQYKELYDTGVITQEEFETKKKQLLGL